MKTIIVVPGMKAMRGIFKLIAVPDGRKDDMETIIGTLFDAIFPGDDNEIQMACVKHNAPGTAAWFLPFGCEFEVLEEENKMTDKIGIKVYLVDGRVMEYFVEDATKAREHAHRIINYGWRNITKGVMEYYPVWQVLKVTFAAPEDIMSKKYETGTEK